MAAVERVGKRGPAERAAEAVPPPAGRAFRFVVVTLLAVSTAALLGAVALLFLVLQHLQAGDPSAFKADIAGVKGEVAGLRADVAKSMASLQKGMADTANEVNSATLQLNDIALSLHKRP